MYSSRSSSNPSSTNQITHDNALNNEASDNSSNLESLSSTHELLKLLAHTKDGKMHFQTLTLQTDFVTWRSVHAMNCSKHHRYEDLTTQDEEGLINFKTNLTQDQSSTLFMILYKALGPVNEKITIDGENLMEYNSCHNSSITLSRKTHL